MAAVSRLQSLTNKTSLQNLIHRHLLRPSAASANSFYISPEPQPSVHFDLQNPKSRNEFLLNWNYFPIGVVSALPAFDFSVMELRGSRSTSSKKRPDLEEDDEDDDDEEDDFDDDDDDDVIDDACGSCNDSDDDDDNFGRRGGGRGGGSRGGGAYTV